ncbi:unnamed protein product [Arabis nemorensis]|uniref:Thioredoxin domain-containing protein n=1 Tax=Arabis nemorensis TaxID=586526 RepID=A0A565BGK7_9BRAS|nr:unnamed protein product [Arabis nemorensis]
MVSTTKIKSVDFYRKIPRDLTEASLSGAGLSIVAAMAMLFLFGMELSNYIAVSTTTSVIVDKSSDGDFVHIDFNISFPALSCEFASVDVSDVLGTKPSWEKAAEITRQVYDPETDGRVLLGSVDCTEEPTLCKRSHIQGYPTIRIFRRGNDLKEDHGHHEHESYYGDRDTESLLKMVEGLLKPIKKEDHKLALDGKTDNAASRIKKATVSGGCRIEGYIQAKKVPGDLTISAHSEVHSFDASQMNMSHFVTHLTFGRVISEKLWTDMKLLFAYIGGSHDRLNGKWFLNRGQFAANVTIEHYLQVVKTEVVSRRFGQEHSLISEYEYTAHSNVAHGYYYPVAKFHYELSPMQILISENPRSFSHFITNVCAIIGGVFTVAGILDSIFQNTVRMVKKIELGKNI